MTSRLGGLVRPVAVLTASFAIPVGVFLAVELGVRVAGMQPPSWPSADAAFDLPQVRVDPLLGPLPAPGWSGDWFGKFELRIDARGFRAAGNAPAAAEKKVVFLGDSCTFGWGVDTADTFIAQLGQLQQSAGNERFAFLNAAFPGHSATVGVHMLRERVLPLKPDAIVLGYSANNAFRFSLASDSDRFRFFGLRKFLLRSRLLHILAAKMVRRFAPRGHPRNRRAISAVPFKQLRRVAATDEFETALRAMVGDARAMGVEVIFLVFPRASGVSTQFRHEDAGFQWMSGHVPKPKTAGGVSPGELDLFEVSCLDNRKLERPIERLYEGLQEWKPVYPINEAVRPVLQQGARAYIGRNFEEAARRFARAVELDPDSPLAHYDLGVSRLAMGDAAGLRDLSEADRLACNVFLLYQVLIWKLAVDLDVAVVDLTLQFQAHDGEMLFLDPAHPNAAGHRLIAEALWPFVNGLDPRSPLKNSKEAWSSAASVSGRLEAVQVYPSAST